MELFEGIDRAAPWPFSKIHIHVPSGRAPDALTSFIVLALWSTNIGNWQDPRGNRRRTDIILPPLCFSTSSLQRGVIVALLILLANSLAAMYCNSLQNRSTRPSVLDVWQLTWDRIIAIPGQANVKDCSISVRGPRLQVIFHPDACFHWLPRLGVSFPRPHYEIANQ